MIILKILGCLCLLLMFSDAANILYVIPLTSMSHYIMLSPIGLELARRGHNVTVISAFKEENHPPTYHQVISDDISFWDALGIAKPNVFSMLDLSPEEFHKNILWEGGIGTTEIALKSKSVQEFLNQEHSFDIVISELFFQEAFHALAHKYNAPLVLVTTYGNNMKNNLILRNPWQIATVLQEHLTVRNPTSLFGRTKNLLFSVYDFLNWKFYYLKRQEALARKYIKDLTEPMPSLYELQKDTSLVLMNSHFSVDRARAYLPNFVEIGGLHLQASVNKLPDDLQKILDEAEFGVVYVNFGSNVQSSEMPIEKKNVFLKVFGRLNKTVIWKWEDSNLDNKSDNIITRNWLPQKEIFAHKNVKLFISHGGLLGIQEAIFHGVPIIGMPIYGDQYNNLLQVEEDGHGQILEYNDLNEITFEKVLKEVLEYDIYKNKAKEIQIRFKDRPMKPLETAMFWIEYVIRHRGANFAKNPALKMHWISSSMIDVYLFIFSLLVGLTFAVVKLYKMAFQQFTKRTYNVKVKRNKKKNN